ncbi:hypothetical protein Tco_0464443 [Tanacetum coccineum]
MVEGEEDEESYASEFADSMFNDDDDSGTRIEPGSRKENAKVVDEDEDKDNDDHTDHTLVVAHATGKELTAPVSPKTATTSKNKSKKGFTSNKIKILLGSIAGICRRRVLDHCNNVVPEMTFAKTNEMIKEEMPLLVNLAVKKDREITPANVPKLISKEFATHRPKMIEELFQKHMRNTTLNLYPTTSSSTAEISTVDLQQ